MIFFLVFILFPTCSLGCPDNIAAALKDQEAVQKVSTYIENLNNALKNKQVSRFNLEKQWANVTFENEHANQLFCEFRKQMKGVSAPGFGWFACAGCKGVFFAISLLDIPNDGIGEEFVKKLKPIFNSACENFSYLPGVSDFCDEMSVVKINIGLYAVGEQIKADGGQVKPGPICDRLSTILNPGDLC
ncbi:hypothetical protein M3Y97_00953400 [Aphelenchoides bicaudatus]|nr:hypothetical protein M3Y97_00953400 [Aphelenchoides bicaudatus]